MAESITSAAADGAAPRPRKHKLGTELPGDVLVTLHRLSYWGRVPISEIIATGIELYAQSEPERQVDADTKLPELVVNRRNLPHQ